MNRQWKNTLVLSEGFSLFHSFFFEKVFFNIFLNDLTIWNTVEVIRTKKLSCHQNLEIEIDQRVFHGKQKKFLYLLKKFLNRNETSCIVKRQGWISFSFEKRILFKVKTKEIPNKDIDKVQYTNQLLNTRWRKKAWAIWFVIESCAERKNFFSFLLIA